MNDDLYEQSAREYAQHSAVNVVNARYERPAMYALLGEVKGKTVLDAGCAGGEYVQHLLAGGARVVAVDRSSAMIEIVRSRFDDRIQAFRHDLREPMTWLNDASIDIILSSLTMHYLESWTVTMREFRRVIKPDGRLLISTHHPAMTAPLAANYFETVLVKDIWNVAGRAHEVRFYHRPLQAIVSECIDAGFAIRRLVEPRLTERIEGLSEEWFQNLGSRAWFLLIEAVPANLPG